MYAKHLRACCLVVEIRYSAYTEDRQPLEAREIIYIPATLARRLVSSPVRYSIIIDYVQLTGGS